MGAFQSGFSMGQSAYQNAQENQLRREQGDRENEAAKRESEKYARVTKIQANTDAAEDAVTALRSGVSGAQQGQLTQTYGLKPSQVAASVQQGGAEGLRAKLAGYDQPDAYDMQSAPALSAPSVSGVAAPQGLAPARFTAADLKVQQASPYEMERAMGNVAAAKGDMEGLRVSNLAAKTHLYDETYAKHIKSWGELTDDKKTDLAQKLSESNGFKGYGSYVLPSGKSPGYMNFMAPGKDTIKLSDAETGKLFALSQLMETDSSRARKEMDESSDKIRAVAAVAFDKATAGATLHNTTQFHKDTAISQRISANASATSARAAVTSAGAAVTTAGAAVTNAGANVQRAQTESDYKNKQIGVIDATQANREVAAEYQDKFSQLTPEEQMGPKGKGLTRLFNLSNAKNGVAVSSREADPGKVMDALKAAVESGAFKTPQEARIYVDQLFGLKKPVPLVNPGLQSANNGTGAGTGLKTQGGNPSAPATPNAPKAFYSPTFSDLQFNQAAEKAGYTSSMGNDGEVYYSRVLNGMGENLTSDQMAKRLGLLN